MNNIDYILDRLDFPNSKFMNQAIALKGYVKAFIEGGILTLPLEGWENVYLHCISEAITADILFEYFEEYDRQLMTKVAFLHDAYKRIEVEKMEKVCIDRASEFINSEEQSKVWLSNLGYSDEIVDLMASYGDSAAINIYNDEINDLGMKILHYIDDITLGHHVVSLEERLTALENNPKYQEQNEWHRRTFNGLTLYQAKRLINLKTEKQIKARVGLCESDSLTDWIKSLHSGGVSLLCC